MGKASFLNIFNLSKFKKSFVMTLNKGEIEGRVEYGNYDLISNLNPGYLKMSLDLASIPATGELSDFQFHYDEPVEFDISEDEIEKYGWPPIKEPSFPLHGGLTDYVRPVGPGVYVGVGYRAPRMEKNDLGRRFLYFALVKQTNI